MSTYQLSKVERLKDGRYTVRRTDGAQLSLTIEEWREAIAEIGRLETFYQITMHRQSAVPR